MESKNAPSIHRTFSARLDRIYTPDGKQRFGKGMLRVALPERELQFDARARGSLELPRSLKIAYPFDSIYNVDVDGRLVSFDLHTPQGLQEILLTIDSATEAEQLVALLPNTRTPDYAELRIQEQSFANALFRATPRTRITQLLIGLNVLAYLFCIVRGVYWLNPTPDQLMHMGANYWPLSTTTQWWRNFTCMFLHFGLIHIGFNMWVLAGAGQIVERLYGRRFFLMGYLYAGIIGSLVSMWFEHVAVSAGASGAVFGVFGMLIAYLIRQRGSIPPLVLKPMLKNALVFVGFNVLFGLSQTGIDNGAHFGGFGGGLLIGMFLSRPLHLPSRHALLTRRLLMAGIIAIASITSIVVAMPKARPGLYQEAQLKTLLQIQENEEAKLHEQFQSGAVLLNQKKIAPAQLSQLITETILPRYELLKQSVDQVEHVPGSRAEVVQQAMRHYYDARIDQFSFDVQLLSEEESAEKPDPDQTRLRRDTLNQKVESAMQELRGAANGLAQP